MLPAFSNIPRFRLGCAGTTSLEFALVATAFFALMFGGMDLGRYFITQHSLRTLTSEMVRATMVQCYATNTACALADVTPSENKVPFLVPARFTTTPSATRTAISPTTGTMTITASASYPFTFLFPAFTSLSGPIAETTQLSY